MPRTPTYPLAEHPLKGFRGNPPCSAPRHAQTYLTTVMLENSIRECAHYVKGTTLDVGCGRRPYEKTFFAGASKYIGTDYLSDRSHPDVVCSALELPFPDNHFDTVVSTEVLEHVPDPLRAMREMRRVLKPDGFLVLSAPLYVQPIAARPVNWLINTFFLWCDRHLHHDGFTLGWTVVARKPGPRANGAV